MALTVFALALGGMVAALLHSRGLARTNAETSLAYEAASAVLEEMRARPFLDIYELYNTTPADDPVGLVATGPGFDVPGLNLQLNDPDGLAGRIEFPGGGGLELREDVVAPEFGLPRDLNADGVIDGADHSDDYLILPVRVVVEWRGVTGNRSIGLETLLSDR